MSKDKLIHVIRPRPEWSTGDPVTICGNKSFDGDLTPEAMKSHIKNKCRGSIHVAYGSCCVTCLSNQKERNWRHSGVDPSVSILADYIERAASGRKSEVKLVVQAEVMAMAELLELHKSQFEEIVKRRMLLAGGYSGLKIVKGGAA